MNWVGHQFRAHWRGIVQAAVFAGCLTVSALVCAGIEALELTGEFFANGVGTGDWAGAAKTLGESAAIDLLSFGVGVAGGRLIDAGVTRGFGLEALDGSAARGVMGKFFGAYKYTGASHVSWHYPGENAASTFGSYLTPEFMQIAFRAAGNKFSCNGTSLGYCP
jgi:hypothetical protein